MARSLTVRNVDDEVFQRLKVRAARHGRSAEAEVRSILAQSVANEPREDFWTIAERLRAATKGRKQTPSEDLIRAMRDER